MSEQVVDAMNDDSMIIGYVDISFIEYGVYITEELFQALMQNPPLSIKIDNMIDILTEQTRRNIEQVLKELLGPENVAVIST